MGTLAFTFALFVMCIVATPDDKTKTRTSVAFLGIASIAVFAARLLAMVVERWGW